MRMSCNGCRVLRKGCSENCTLRPCLHWIKSPESQANATVFLAKFYGRAGLINLINAGPDHLRPAIFRSLLYEACGRIINPIYGSVGLMWAGNWDRCQEAVEAVLRGSEIMQVNIEDGGGGSGAESHPIMPFKGCDIRHLSKESSGGVHRIRSRNRFKRTGTAHDKAVDHLQSLAEFMEEDEEAPAKFSITGWAGGGGCETAESVGLERAPSHGSSSLETVEPALVNRDNPVSASMRTADRGSDDELLLDLTLGFNSVERPHVSTVDKHSVGDV
ncbi:LOB domain-containing protein 40-like [Ipomoea triloba]|uniref:LOB domain-containing protein 40-like n=1 Tax=Ipomoea triloba TaxID=35885 RepID=UPI00125DC2C6|nr:LOB domain-containing protein 40-like [Ipomoea triloba]